MFTLHCELFFVLRLIWVYQCVRALLCSLARQSNRVGTRVVYCGMLYSCLRVFILCTPKWLDRETETAMERANQCMNLIWLSPCIVVWPFTRSLVCSFLWILFYVWTNQHPLAPSLSRRSQHFCECALHHFVLTPKVHTVERKEAFI